jgi:hypothetical protein
MEPHNNAAYLSTAELKNIQKNINDDYIYNRISFNEFQEISSIVNYELERRMVGDIEMKDLTIKTKKRNHEPTRETKNKYQRLSR